MSKGVMYACEDCGWYGRESGVTLGCDPGENVSENEYAICKNCGSTDAFEVEEYERKAYREAWKKKKKESKK